MQFITLETQSDTVYIVIEIYQSYIYVYIHTYICKCVCIYINIWKIVNKFLAINCLI